MGKVFFSTLFLALLLSCGSGGGPDRKELEEVYVDLVRLGIPGRVPEPGEVESLESRIDSLGGRSAVESLLVRSMLADAEGWNELIDSLAGTMR